MRQLAGLLENAVLYLVVLIAALPLYAISMRRRR
jgi:hypothetical protein